MHWLPYNIGPISEDLSVFPVVTISVLINFTQMSNSSVVTTKQLSNFKHTLWSIQILPYASRQPESQNMLSDTPKVALDALQ